MSSKTRLTGVSWAIYDREADAWRHAMGHSAQLTGHCLFVSADAARVMIEALCQGEKLLIVPVELAVGRVWAKVMDAEYYVARPAEPNGSVIFKGG